MQVSNLVLIIALEIYLALFLATLGLLYFAFKQKNLIKRQQDKLKELLALLNAQKNQNDHTETNYGEHIREQLALTSDHFKSLDPRSQIDAPTGLDAPLSQRIAALRHAFLSAEASVADTPPNDEIYWPFLTRALEPLLQKACEPQDKNAEELEIYKKRVENLEQFKKLFFELEERWNQAQAKAQIHYNELHVMTGGVPDAELYMELLEQYSQSYNDLQQYIPSSRSIISDAPPENKTINIIRQDPRAADEIVKLRNVAADQYRTIGDLQRKLDKTLSSEEKDSIIKELDQQLQRQMRFVQESDTCIQLLEEELHKANEKIAHQEHEFIADKELAKESQQIKNALHNFAQESKVLLVNIESLARENEVLKQGLDTAALASANEVQESGEEITELRKQYADLEGKYLALKAKQ